jgi:peptide/nickel transport system substrate-binding protein
MEPEYGGKYKMTFNVTLATLDMYQQSNQGISYWIWEGLTAFETLGYLDMPDEQGRRNQFEHYKIIPKLAESWEQPNDNTIIFHLRKNVKWHDGKDFTADDVIFSYERMKKPENRYSGAAIFSGKTLEKVDPYTVRVNMQKPDPEFLNRISAVSWVMMPKHIGDQGNPDRGGVFHKQAIGTGIMRVKSVDTDNWTKLEAERHPDYWMQGRPYLDAYEIVFGLDISTRIAAFCARENDGIVLSDEKQLAVLKGCLPNVGYALPLNASSHSGFRFHLEKKPYDDIRIRRAIHLAFDRQEMININSAGNGAPNFFNASAILSKGLTGGEVPGVPISEWTNQPGLRQPKDQDIAEAKRLMAEAGYPNGFKMKVQYTTELSYGEPIGQIFTNQMKRTLGLDVEAINMDAPTYNRYAQDGTGPEDLHMSAGSGPTWPSMNTGLLNNWRSGGQLTGIFGWHGDPKLDVLIDQFVVEMNESRRRALFADIQRYFMDNLLFIPTVNFAVPQAYQPYIHQTCSQNSGFYSNRCGFDTWMEVAKANPDRRTR